MGGFSTFGSDVIIMRNQPVRHFYRFFYAGQWWLVDQVPYVDIDSEGGFVVSPQGYNPPEPKAVARVENQYLDVRVRAIMKSIEAGEGVRLLLRYMGEGGNAYLVPYVDLASLGLDFSVWKYVRGTLSRIAAESVELTNVFYDCVGEVVGSTLRISRDGGASFPVIATDTSITNPGFVALGARDNWCVWVVKSIGPPASPAPKPIGYFEVPVVGSGTSEDPFRAQLPEQILGGTNILALTHSALIKTGSDGKPREYTAIVRVFDQPDRPGYLAPVDKALEALKAIQGVRQLTRDEALRRAKQLDDKLTDLDLLSARELKKDVKAAAREYKSWRTANLGVKEELINDDVMARYAEEDKGW